MAAGGEMPYLSREGLEKVKQYKYQGGDHSYLYQHVLSPWAEFCVKTFTPEWVACVFGTASKASREITLAGFLLVVLAYYILYWFAPLFEPTAPWWAGVFAGFSLFAYQTLDNMDGKQARRTGSSNALGLLFDHGCDCLHSGLIGPMLFGSVLGLGTDLPGVLLLWAIANVPFFFNTWEHYHTDHFTLPEINGPSDGLFMISVIMALSGIFGPGFLWSPVPFAMNLAVWQVVALVLGVGGLLTVLRQAYSVAVFLRNNNREDEVLPAFGRTVPFLTVVAAAASFYVLGNDLYRVYPRLIFLIVGCASADLTIKLMVAHVGEEEYHGTWRTVAWAVAVPLHLALRKFLGLGLDPSWDFTLLVIAAAGMSIQLAWFGVATVNELANALGVFVFRLPKKHD